MLLIVFIFNFIYPPVIFYIPLQWNINFERQLKFETKGGHFWTLKLQKVINLYNFFKFYVNFIYIPKRFVKSVF